MHRFSYSNLLANQLQLEIHKTIHHIKHYDSSCVALQMPEGLTLWATAISDIIERYIHESANCNHGDVTYGACCVDDYTARALGADLLIHYGHSCLVPVDQTSIRTLYVFVEIAIDPDHICATIRTNFPALHYEFQESIIKAQDRMNSIQKQRCILISKMMANQNIKSDLHILFWLLRCNLSIHCMP
ncbi:hypothetical protein L7F22_066074 [Adiantum nelumboides]|nr:hypothetical protein [Adiantum nelumboides]